MFFVSNYNIADITSVVRSVDLDVVTYEQHHVIMWQVTHIPTNNTVSFCDNELTYLQKTQCHYLTMNSHTYK